MKEYFSINKFDEVKKCILNNLKAHQDTNFSNKKSINILNLNSHHDAFRDFKKFIAEHEKELKQEIPLKINLYADHQEIKNFNGYILEN